MPTGKLVPWISWREWEGVRGDLLSPATHRQQRGVDKVAAWRGRGEVPSAVDFTASLVAASLADTPAAWLPAGLQALRLQYALALIRFVNGIADAAQTKRVAQPVAALATSAGLSRMLVDIRHEATHGELPSLPVLRLGLAEALAWLADAYWRSQAEELRDREEVVAEKLQAYVDSWKSASTKLVKHVPKGQAEESEMAAGGEGEGYQGAEGKKLRKKLLSELWECGVSSRGEALVQPLLDGALQPPCPSSQDKVERRAWESALGGLAGTRPALPALLLQGAVARLTDPGQALSPKQSALAAAWVAALLQHSARQANPPGGVKSPGGSGKKKSSKGSDVQAAHSGGDSGKEAGEGTSQAQVTDLLAACVKASSSLALSIPSSSLSSTAGEPAALLAAPQGEAAKEGGRLGPAERGERGQGEQQPSSAAEREEAEAAARREGLRRGLEEARQGRLTALAAATKSLQVPVFPSLAHNSQARYVLLVSVLRHRELFSVAWQSQPDLVSVEAAKDYLKANFLSRLVERLSQLHKLASPLPTSSAPAAGPPGGALGSLRRREEEEGGAQPDSGAQKELQEAAQKQGGLLAGLQSARKRKREEAAAIERPRWRLAGSSWKPCAIGMLPCLHNPNGRLPLLTLPEKEEGAASPSTPPVLAERKPPHGADSARQMQQKVRAEQQGGSRLGCGPEAEKQVEPEVEPPSAEESAVLPEWAPQDYFARFPPVPEEPPGEETRPRSVWQAFAEASTLGVL